ncbi:MAG: hypothetical protein AAB417_04015 [Patescibacteria group bacterium]
MKKGFWQFMISAAIAGPIVFLVIYCARLAITNAAGVSTPLEAGTKLPPEFTHLVVGNGQAGIQLRGAYRKEGREVRFFTVRGLAISMFERRPGAPDVEMSMCFVNEQGYPLFTVAGGDGVPISECNKAGGEFDSDKTTDEEMQLAREAMRAIAKLSFRPEYEPERWVLVGSLAIANTFDHVLADEIHLP